ncbi:hypothetical protein CR203_08950 [Salipaludibacillus neizhouensis]|uniref:GrpB family protein n=1 Tax=Salipaludibacillus neizhouensis TaxID=885475 RepID=A0A3A9KAJ0_9BACI|nr:GrpB family protein [Salipaludibacillus neizhouensis]RKL67471.1 hypothetical protein CR203_08950 [Salipaludibacillus neizhouensis]
MRKVEVVSYREEWTLLFQEESIKISRIFGSECIHLYHIGSTAIPNMHAKPVIDILVEVQKIENVDSFNLEMERIGYVAMGENGIEGRRFYKKGGNNRSHHVHVFGTQNREIQRHIVFKDYLIAHPHEADRYSQLKQLLAKKYPDDIEKYIDGKNNFIKDIDAKANRWLKGR